MNGVTRREAISIIAGGAAASALSCRRPSTNEPADRVVLYSSVDTEFLTAAIGPFETSRKVRVLLKGDTEATKSTGLAERLRQEHRAGTPRADVFWSSEPFLSMALAAEGVLAPLPRTLIDPWPAARRDPSGRWVGFAERVRVVVYSTKRFTPETASSIADVCGRGFGHARPVIARPAFGTTRGHAGALLAFLGQDLFTTWARSLKSNGVQLADGNSSVVRAVAQGESPCGLTDSDDVWSALREGWPVGCVAATMSRGETVAGPLYFPNTVGLVAGGANPSLGAELAAYIASEAVERLLMASTSGNIPVRENLRAQMRARSADRIFHDPLAATPSLPDIAANTARAVEILDREWGA